jgi:hypothetical protein
VAVLGDHHVVLDPPPIPRRWPDLGPVELK